MFLSNIRKFVFMGMATCTKKSQKILLCAEKIPPFTDITYLSSSKNKINLNFVFKPFWYKITI